MGSFQATPFGLTGSEINIAEALTAIERVLRDGEIDLDTRDVLVLARCALRDEID